MDKKPPDSADRLAKIVWEADHDAADYDAAAS